MDQLMLYFNYCWVLKVIEFLLFLLFFAVLLMSNNKFTSVFGFEHRVCLLFLAYCQFTTHKDNCWLCNKGAKQTILVEWCILANTGKNSNLACQLKVDSRALLFLLSLLSCREIASFYSKTIDMACDDEETKYDNFLTPVCCCIDIDITLYHQRQSFSR